MAEVLLKEGEWLPVANNKWTVDGRNIPEEVFTSIIYNKEKTGHIPYWTIGHQRGNDKPRVGSISDFKYQDGELFVKSSNMDQEFMTDVENGKYPHLSIEIYPLFEGKEVITNDTTGESEEVEAWGWMFNGVAAISRNAAFPQYHLIQFGREEEQLFIPNSLQFPVEVGQENIRVRVRLTDDFEKSSFRTINIDKDKGIKSVVGRLKTTGKSANQTFIFSLSNDWTESTATKWVEDKGYTIMERSHEDINIFVANILKTKKGVNDFMETKQEVEIKEVENTEEIKLEVEEKIEETVIEEPKKKVGRPKKDSANSVYGKDYKLKQSMEYQMEVKAYEKEIERAREDKAEYEKKIIELEKKVETLQNTILEQDFIIQAEYFMQQNKINYNDLGIPESVIIEKPTDFILHSEVFKEHWKNTASRQLLMAQWNAKAAIEIDNSPLGNKTVKYDEKKIYTDDELVEMETKEQCKEKNIPYNSSKGMDIEQRVAIRHEKMPWELRKKHNME